MARMKFLCDADRCIECNACVTACKNEHEVPWGINRRRVVTLNDGKPGERSVSMACMHCTDAPCAAVCPVIRCQPSSSRKIGSPSISERSLGASTSTKPMTDGSLPPSEVSARSILRMPIESCRIP